MTGLVTSIYIFNAVRDSTVTLRSGSSLTN